MSEPMIQFRVLDELAGFIEKRKNTLRALSDFIYANPELGYEEVQASRKIGAYLTEAGFKVELGVGSLPTAVRAWFENNAAENTPAVCIPAEYDALSGLGHGCGHNLISACSIAAAVAASEYAKKHGIPFRICLMGTPAEEGKGGKVVMIREGAFNGINMAVMAHPSKYDLPETGSLGVARALITFHGKASHAGGAPKDGINALDAMVYYYMDMLQWKAGLAPRERVHGIITKGGDAANIIPDLTEAFFYVRAPESGALKVLMKKLEDSVKTGAEKTGCTSEVKWVSAYQPVLYNLPLSERFAECWHELGKEIPMTTGTENCGSTDMGDVTRIMPGAHFHFSITEAEKCPCHSVLFREAAGSDYGFESALKCASVLAKIVLDYSMDESFRKAVDADFRKRSQENS